MASKKKKTSDKIKTHDIPEDRIKYHIRNTPLPVIITHDNELFLVDIDPKDNELILKKNAKKIAEYQQKVAATMEYLFLEGFLTGSQSNMQECEGEDEE